MSCSAGSVLLNSFIIKWIRHMQYCCFFFSLPHSTLESCFSSLLPQTDGRVSTPEGAMVYECWWVILVSSWQRRYVSHTSLPRASFVWQCFKVTVIRTTLQHASTVVVHSFKYVTCCMRMICSRSWWHGGNWPIGSISMLWWHHSHMSHQSEENRGDGLSGGQTFDLSCRCWS